VQKQPRKQTGFKTITHTYLFGEINIFFIDSKYIIKKIVFDGSIVVILKKYIYIKKIFFYFLKIIFDINILKHVCVCV
jgi:hypothetical protein